MHIHTYLLYPPKESLKTQEFVMILANNQHWLDIFENHVVLISILSNVLKVCSFLTWLPSHMSFQKVLSSWVRSTKMIVASMLSGLFLSLDELGLFQKPTESLDDLSSYVWLVLPLVGCCLCPQVVKLAWISRGDKTRWQHGDKGAMDYHRIILQKFIVWFFGWIMFWISISRAVGKRWWCKLFTWNSLGTSRLKVLKHSLTM